MKLLHFSVIPMLLLVFLALVAVAVVAHCQRLALDCWLFCAGPWLM